jgi:hypothetical protein
MQDFVISIELTKVHLEDRAALGRNESSWGDLDSGLGSFFSA